jgi:hypothetical protein
MIAVRRVSVKIAMRASIRRVVRRCVVTAVQDRILMLAWRHVPNATQVKAITTRTPRLPANLAGQVLLHQLALRVVVRAQTGSTQTVLHALTALRVSTMRMTTPRQCVWIVLLEKHPRHLLLSARGVRLALMLRLARRLAHSAQPDWLTPTATHRVHVQLVLQVSTLASVQQSAHRVLPVV